MYVEGRSRPPGTQPTRVAFSYKHLLPLCTAYPLHKFSRLTSDTISGKHERVDLLGTLLLPSARSSDSVTIFAAALCRILFFHLQCATPDGDLSICSVVDREPSDPPTRAYFFLIFNRPWKRGLFASLVVVPGRHARSLQVSTTPRHYGFSTCSIAPTINTDHEKLYSVTFDGLRITHATSVCGCEHGIVRMKPETTRVSNVPVTDEVVIVNRSAEVEHNKRSARQHTPATSNSFTPPITRPFFRSSVNPDASGLQAVGRQVTGIFELGMEGATMVVECERQD